MMMRELLNLTTQTILLAVCLIYTGCCDTISDSVYGSNGPAIIYPDYKDVTIPKNIAPLNFHYAVKGARNAATTFTVGDKTVVKHGIEVKWTTREWKNASFSNDNQRMWRKVR